MQSEETVRRAARAQLHVLPLIVLHVGGGFQGLHPQIAHGFPVGYQESLLGQVLDVAVDILFPRAEYRDGAAWEIRVSFVFLTGEGRVCLGNAMSKAQKKYEGNLYGTFLPSPISLCFLGPGFGLLGNQILASLAWQK